MNLPKDIEAEIAKGPRNRTFPASFDNQTDYTPETDRAFARRIARMVAEDCAKQAELLQANNQMPPNAVLIPPEVHWIKGHNAAAFQIRGFICTRYGLDEQTGDSNDPN